LSNELIYGTIAREYRESERLPFRRFIEEHTLFLLLGDLTGKSVLDLACGDGIWTREMKRRGAARALGVDISRAMVELALEDERVRPMGCEYRVGDAAGTLAGESFDLVVGCYLLNYARNPGQLLGFCRAIHGSLRPGGRFVGFNDNPANLPEHCGIYQSYGFLKWSPPARREGDPVTYTLFNPDGSEFTFDNFFLSPETYEWAFREAGFSSFAWRGPWLSREGKAAFPAGYWDAYLQDPPMVGLEASW
jgi:toxoflavin synthase